MHSHLRRFLFPVLFILLLPGLVQALDMRRWDADVSLVRNQVLSDIAKRATADTDQGPPDRFFKWLLTGLKEVQADVDADSYLIMREAALTIAEELGTAREALCSPDEPEVCRERMSWALVQTMFDLKLDYVRNIMAIMD